MMVSRRAETLKARAYDGDLARIDLPRDAGLDWLRAVADPADDLRVPMKGPFTALRDTPADLHRAGLALAKAAHLLPAVLVVPIVDGLAFAASHALTFLSLAEIAPELTRPSPLHLVSAARVPLLASDAGGYITGHTLSVNGGGYM